VKWSARWDGTTLTVAQRPTMFLWLALVAVLVLVPGTARFVVMAGAMGLTDVLVLLGVGLVAVSVPALVITGWQTVTIDPRVGLTQRGWRTRPTIAPSKLAKVLLRTEERMQTTRWGTGKLPFAVLSAHTTDGRTEELLVLDARALDPASREAFRAALAALPFGEDRLA
jgi:hypothetical protein